MGVPALPRVRLEAPLDDARRRARWGFERLAGGLTELTATGGGAVLTFAVEALLDAQRQGETTAWVTGTAGSFFPPDAADAGLDLEALVVVRVTSSSAALRAADLLLRSGGFGLVVLDLVDLLAPPTGPGFAAGPDPRSGGRPGRRGPRGAPPPPTAAVARLAGLARRHDAALLVLVEKTPDTASLGSLVGLRAEAVRESTQDGRSRCLLRALKDKRRPPGWTHVVERHGPDGWE